MGRWQWPQRQRDHHQGRRHRSQECEQLWGLTCPPENLEGIQPVRFFLLDDCYKDEKSQKAAGYMTPKQFYVSLVEMTVLLLLCGFSERIEAVAICNIMETSNCCTKRPNEHAFKGCKKDSIKGKMLAN